MKAVKTLVLAACILGVVAPTFAATFVDEFACTKDTFVGRALYGSDSNYGSKAFGRTGKGEQDGMIMDFDRPGMLSWINTTVQAQPGGTGITITNINQIANGALTMTLNVTAYPDAWDESSTLPPTLYGHYVWPAVRLSKGTANWGEMTATFNSSTTGVKWNDQNGTPMLDLYTNKYMLLNNTIMNATSVPWGGPLIDDGFGGVVDTYVADTVRPFPLDDAVAFAALTNPDVACFQLLADMYNKPWAGTSGEDDNTGAVYAREHGSTQFRPTVDITIDTAKIIAQTPSTKTYLPGDCDKSGKVTFSDYLTLEQNFGKTGKSWADGDFVNMTGGLPADGRVSFQDYLQLEQNFGKSSVPEPATMSLLVLGGLAMLKRRSA